MLISAPDDYGLSATQTLEHCCEDAAADGFEAFWADLRDEVHSIPPRLIGRIDDAINPVTFQSIRSVRIAAQLSLPDGESRGAVLTSHGAEAPDIFEDTVEPWTHHGLETLRIRVRGYPPSTIDIDDRRDHWVLFGIESASDWILRGAVADLVQAYRCLRHRCGAGFPISLHGESFGAGLAVMAASELTRAGDPPFRLAIGLPSLGDWSWRSTRYCRGLGVQVNTMRETWRDHGEILEHTLALFDASVHARIVGAPTLCKLATLDDVVPAPAAASVFNGLASVDRWRFVTRFGHFDGGIADLRRHATFERLHPAFLDPSVEPSHVSREIDMELQA